MSEMDQTETMLRFVDEFEGDLLKMDGFDSCIVGVVTRIGSEPAICYDKEKVIEQLMREGPMSYEDAIEYHEFNQAGAYVGPATPFFLVRPE